MSDQTYTAKCACGAVELEVSGEPIAQAYCHCVDCRAWLSAPVHGATLWPPQSVKFNKGEDNLILYKRTENSHRKSCKSCGSAVLSDHPGAGFTDVLAATMPDFPFQPAMHVFYGEKMIRLADGLPKFADMPAEFGGSGTMADE